MKFRHVSEILKSCPPTQSWGCVWTIKSHSQISLPREHREELGLPSQHIPSKVNSAAQIPLPWVASELLWKSLPAAAALEAGQALDQSWVFPKEPRDRSTAFKRRMTAQDVKTEMRKDTFLPPGTISLFTKCQLLNSSKQQHQPSTINLRKWLERIDFIPTFK